MVAQMVKNLPTMWETWVQSLGQEDPLEEGMATYSSILAWRIPWTEEPGRLQTMGLQRVRHDRVTQHTARFGHPGVSPVHPGSPGRLFSSGLLHLLCSVRNVLKFIFKYMNISSFPLVAILFFCKCYLILNRLLKDYVK